MSLWREMMIEDIPYVYNIANDIWTMHKEDRIIYENKFCSFPQGCYVYDDNGIKGYIISHPYNISSPPKINTLLPNVEINCLFIHDIVIVSEYRGRGIGNEIINTILDNNPIVSLVACDDTAKHFWLGYGFEVAETLDCDYGIYMVKNIDKLNKI
jgi:ribosomal protein S18 acetylase RimI-like enzyme